jgi:hypothetical protein
MQMTDAVKTALSAGNKDQSDQAMFKGISKQAINNKMARGTWTGKDLTDVAALSGGRLLIEYPDGSKIVFDTDYFGEKRDSAPLPGPFASTGEAAKQLF